MQCMDIYLDLFSHVSVQAPGSFWKLNLFTFLFYFKEELFDEIFQKVPPQKNSLNGSKNFSFNFLHNLPKKNKITFFILIFQDQSEMNDSTFSFLYSQVGTYYEFFIPLLFLCVSVSICFLFSFYWFLALRMVRQHISTYIFGFKSFLVCT